MQWRCINWRNGLKIAMKLNKLALTLLLLLTACSVQKTETPAQKMETPPPEQPTVPTELPQVTPPPPRKMTPDASHYSTQGLASVYPKQSHGSSMASGEIYDIYGMTAAVADLPFNARVEVTNPLNGNKVVLSVQDRLTTREAVIQLSYIAAELLELRPGMQVTVRGLPAR
jgi:rare lipoprotein A